MSLAEHCLECGDRLPLDHYGGLCEECLDAGERDQDAERERGQ